MARLLNCSAIHCTENVLLVWKHVCMWIPPLHPVLFLPHSLSPLSVSLSKSFELNVLCSENFVNYRVRPVREKGEIWPFGRPYPDPCLFSHLWVREEDGAEIRGKGIEGLVVFLLRTLKIWSLFALLKYLNFFCVMPCSCKLPFTLPTVFCEPGLN